MSPGFTEVPADSLCYPWLTTGGSRCGPMASISLACEGCSTLQGYHETRVKERRVWVREWGKAVS